MVGKKKAKVKSSNDVGLTQRQKYIISEKTRLCIEDGIAPTPENFEKYEMWDTYGRTDNYLQGVKDTWGKWNEVNNYILYCCKPERKALTASEVNAIMREAGII
jgi:hypothetical protein